MKHVVSFDIDGTLLNTHELNREAYRRFGVDVPDYALGLRWQTWLPNVLGSFGNAEEIHTKKVHLYAEMLRTQSLDSHVLPPAHLARSLLRRTDINVTFLTSGTLTTANIILQRLGLRAPLAANLSYEARRLVLHSSVLGSDGAVIYIDDLDDNVKRLKEDVPGLAAIQFTTQDLGVLRNQVQQVMQRVIS